MEYIEIKEQIKQKLPVARDLGDSENLLELGLSSLTIMRLVNQWRKQGFGICLPRGKPAERIKRVEFCFLSRTAETGRRGGTEKRRKILEESFRAFAKRP